MVAFTKRQTFFAEDASIRRERGVGKGRTSAAHSGRGRKEERRGGAKRRLERNRGKQRRGNDGKKRAGSSAKRKRQKARRGATSGRCPKRRRSRNEDNSKRGKSSGDQSQERIGQGLRRDGRCKSRRRAEAAKGLEATWKIVAARRHWLEKAKGDRSEQRPNHKGAVRARRRRHERPPSQSTWWKEHTRVGSTERRCVVRTQGSKGRSVGLRCVHGSGARTPAEAEARDITSRT